VLAFSLKMPLRLAPYSITLSLVREEVRAVATTVVLESRWVSIWHTVALEVGYVASWCWYKTYRRGVLHGEVIDVRVLIHVERG
jgi:hypothetical protein